MTGGSQPIAAGSLYIPLAHQRHGRTDIVRKIVACGTYADIHREIYG